VFGAQQVTRCVLGMCHGEYHASVNLQPFPSGRNRDMFVVNPVSEGGTEPVAAPQRRPALVSSCKTAHRDWVPRGTRRDERGGNSRRSGDMVGLLCHGGQLNTRAAATNGVLAQLQSGEGACILLADCQEPGAGDVVAEWGLIRDRLDKINRFGSADVSMEVSKALFGRTMSLPCEQLALLRRGAQGLIRGGAPKAAADGSEVKSTDAPPEVQDPVPADDLAVGRALGCTVSTQDVCQSQLSAAVWQPHTHCSLQPDGKQTGVFDIECESRADEGSAPVVQMQGMCTSQPNALAGDPASSTARAHKECEPTGLQYGQLGMGDRRTGADTGGGTETYPGKAGEVQSMVDELLNATSSALDTNLQTSVELSSLKSKFQSLLDDIHAMQSSVGSRTEAPQRQGAGCKDAAASLHSTPGIAKSCSRASSQEFEVGSITFTCGDSDTNEALSEDWDLDVLETDSNSDENASDEDMWSDWSYDFEEAGAVRTSANAATKDAGLNFGSSPCVLGPCPDVGAGYDPIPGLLSVSSNESLTCLVEQDTGLVSLCQDDPQACTLVGRKQADSPDMVGCMRLWSPLLDAEEMGQGEEDGLLDQPASMCGDHTCQCDEVEASRDSSSRCGGPEEVAVVTIAGDEVGMAETAICNWQNPVCLPRGIFITVDKGLEEALRAGALNHFEGVECWEAEGCAAGLCMGSSHAERIHGCAGQKDLVLVCAGHIGCSMGSHEGYTESGVCPTSKGGYTLNAMEVIAPQEQRPQEWSRIVITDLKLFLGSLCFTMGSGIVDGGTAIALPPPCPPARLGVQAAPAKQLTWNRPDAASLALADGSILTVRDPALTASLSPRKSALVLGPPRGFVDVRKFSLMGLSPGAHQGLLGAPTDACIHLDSPLNMPWSSSSFPHKAQLDYNPLPASQDEVKGDNASREGEQDGDSSEDNDTISASGWEPGLWGTDYTALKVAGYRLNSCDLAAWGSSKQGLPRTGHSESRAMMQCGVGGMHRKYDGHGICALQISMERPARGAGGRLQHGMCIHNTGNRETCEWCTPAWKQKVQLKSLMDTGAHNFWSLWLRRTQNACKLFMHWWALRVEKRFRDFQLGVFN